MSEFDLSGDTSADYGFDGTDSFTSGSENVSTTGPSGGGGDENFFGGSDYNVMDFGRGPVSNITNSPNYDPNFAALGMIGRGLTPGFDLRNQINFDVPASMLPQLEGSRGPLGPKFYSPLERTLVEMEPVGIMAMAGKAFESIKNSFTDAKNTLGKMGDAAGGLSLSDLFSSANPMSDMPNEQANMGTLDPSDRFLGDMSQQGARMNVTDPVVNTPNVNMGSIPQVSPTFDAFGNVTRDADISRFADDIGQTRAGIANLLPEQNREANVTVNDAIRSTIPTNNFNASEFLDDFKRGLIERQIENNKRNRDKLLSKENSGITNISNMADIVNSPFNKEAIENSLNIPSRIFEGDSARGFNPNINYSGRVIETDRGVGAFKEAMRDYQDKQFDSFSDIGNIFNKENLGFGKPQRQDFYNPEYDRLMRDKFFADSQRKISI